MTPERWQQVKETLADALERDDTTARRAFLDRRCSNDTALRREVEALLAEPDSPFEELADSGGLLQAPVSSNIGRRIGAYELVRELGRGGMGAVWLARRVDREFHKEVAIKLLKRGTDTDEVLRRFRAEREILARLEHPNIARLFDGGTTDDGLPYFIMEYVAGTRLTDYCTSQRLTIGERLRLFLKVCGAVQFAHQNLVVHRDLKPGNILVTEDGEPKLLDFGVAKMLAAEGDAFQVTAAGNERFTPGYASPEQVRGESITTVSDVYSLGALLYELLTGVPSHRFPTATPGAVEIARVVCEREPPRPSAVAPAPETRRKLRGDLDVILLRALAKDPARRYRGAAQLADDLRRFLEDRPVLARPDTLGYRAGKFLRRNKALTAAAALILGLIVVGLGATTYEARRAARRFEDVRELANGFLFEFHDSIRDIPGALAARQLVTRRAVQYLDSLAAEAGRDLQLRAELATGYEKIGDITFDLPGGIEAHQKSVLLAEDLVKDAPHESAYRVRLARGYTHLCDALKIYGDSRRSLDYGRKAVRLLQPLLDENPDDPRLLDQMSEAHLALSIAASECGEVNLALEQARLALETQNKAIGPAPATDEQKRALASGYSRLGQANLDSGLLDEAEAWCGKFYALAADLFASHPGSSGDRRLMWSAHSLQGRLDFARGNLQSAEQHFRHALELMENLAAADPYDKGHRRWLAVTYARLAAVLAQTQREQEALALYERAARLSDSLLQDDPDRTESRTDLAQMYESEAMILRRQGRGVTGDELLQKARALELQSAARDPANQLVQARLRQIESALGAPKP